MKKFFSGRFFIGMVVILALLLGMMANFLIGGGTLPPQQVIGVLLTPFQSAAVSVRTGVSDFFHSFGERDSLRSENEELRRRITELENRMDESYLTESENQRLRALLGLTEEENSFTYTEADVVSVSSGGWQAAFSVNKGSAAGISRRDVVVTPDGLVGYVQEVGINWAKIIALTDPQVGVGAVVLRTGDAAVSEGTPELKADGKFRITHLDPSAAVNRGDIVCTSGLGGSFPAGLRLGTVSDIFMDDSGLSKSAVITPSADLVNLKKVYIINNFVPE